MSFHFKLKLNPNLWNPKFDGLDQIIFCEWFLLLAAGGSFAPVKEEDDEYDVALKEKKKADGIRVK